MTKPFLVRFFLFLVFFSTLGTLAQGSLKYTVTVFDTNLKPKANLEIVLVETHTFTRKVFKTNTQGLVAIDLTEGADWMLNVGEMKNYKILQVPANGSATGNIKVTYDVAYWNRVCQPPVDRSTLTLIEVSQRISAQEMPDQTTSVVEIQVTSESGELWAGIPVKMTCFNLNTSFTAYTDDEGLARFRVPINQSYQIDLDGENDFEFFDVGASPSKVRVILTYNKINFKETLNADGFTVQTFVEKPVPVSNRVMVTLTIRGGNNNGIHEKVYLDMSYSEQKFIGTTDSEGKVVFLLPKKRSYRLSFDFQKDAAVIDLTRFMGIGYMNMTVSYVPDPRLEFPEQYLPSAKDIKYYDLDNYLTTRYADTPDDNLINVHVKWGNQKINSGSLEALLELGFSVKKPDDKKAISKPLNLAFVLDKSGSMSGESFDILKAAMAKFIDKLRPEDKISVVFFDDEAVVAYSADVLDKSVVQDVVLAAQADGGTDIYAGLELGYKEVARRQNSNFVNRVILLTDGYGGTPIEEILEQSAQYFSKGISVSTIGVGYGYNQALLSLLSKYSGGLEHQALESTEIHQALEAEFESLFHPLASDLKVKVRYNNHIIYRTLYGVPESKNTDNCVEFELDRVYSSLNRMVLMKFKLEHPSPDIARDIIGIEVSYFDEVSQKPVKIVRETHLEWTDETDTEMIIDEQMKLTYSIAVINQTLKAIADFCDAKNYQAAADNIRQTLKSLEEINRATYNEALIPLIEQLKTDLETLNRVIKKGN